MNSKWSKDLNIKPKNTTAEGNHKGKAPLCESRWWLLGSDTTGAHIKGRGDNHGAKGHAVHVIYLIREIHIKYM